MILLKNNKKKYKFKITKISSKKYLFEGNLGFKMIFFRDLIDAKKEANLYYFNYQLAVDPFGIYQ